MKRYCAFVVKRASVAKGCLVVGSRMLQFVYWKSDESLNW
jgi:hypothetical protein